MHQQPGFTLIEFCIALALVAVLLTLGVPSMIESIKSTRTRSTSDVLYSTLVEARSEAIKQNQTITVSITSSGAAVTGPGYSKTVLFEGAANGLSVTTDSVLFNSLGQEKNAHSHTINVLAPNCVAIHACQAIQVFGGGFVKACNAGQTDPNAANYCRTS